MSPKTLAGPKSAKKRAPQKKAARKKPSRSRADARPKAARKKAARTRADSGSKTARRKAAKSQRPDEEVPVRRFRSGRFVRLILVGATILLAATLGTSSVRTWVNQRAQLDGANREAGDLDARIASLEAEIATRTSAEGARIEALCFGPYVEPGVEVYSIPGVDGCVSDG